ncbi:MAG: hypothetical protein L0H75_05370 [Nitrosospira sp.]|nr:hypothetical protein [Nitrosospira sp.]
MFSIFKVKSLSAPCGANGARDTAHYRRDHRWYGEVPRTYFYDRKHQREAKTGLISKKFVEDWLARNVAPDSGPH